MRRSEVEVDSRVVEDMTGVELAHIVTGLFVRGTDRRYR